uniref:Uncharacterized protein n=1 Tax=Rhizophora mucronata TaxID=61149 RepID=A0A2P2QVU9_RHIMU
MNFVLLHLVNII